MSKLLPFFTAISLSLMIAPAFAATCDKNPAQYKCHPSTKGVISDRGILAWVVVLDKNEIAASQVAVSRNIHPSVKEYARWLNQQHNNNLQQTFIVSHELHETPLKNKLAINMQKDGQKELAKLKSLSDKQFEGTFLKAMIEGHTQALHEIDALIKKAKDPVLVKQLHKTHRMVLGHLIRAKQLYRKLNG